MPYTNTQHQYSTRTKVTIVLSIIFGVSIIPTTLGSTELVQLYYTLENADVPVSLYQEVKVKIQKGTETVEQGTSGAFKSEDKFQADHGIYFIKAADTTGKAAECVGLDITTNGAVNGIIPRSIAVGTDTNTAEATVIIKTPEFEVGETYKLCYVLRGRGETGVPPVYEAIYKSTGGDTKAFTVGPSIFTAQVTKPATIYAGKGYVELSTTVAGDKVFLRGEGTQRAYLIPCQKDECLRKDIAQLCGSSTNVPGAVSTDMVKGFSSAKLKTTFFAQVTAAAYMVCIPYCFKTGSCTSELSWALVGPNTPIKFITADPSSYTIEASSPQARTLTKITFTGTGLNDGDKIRIVPQGEVCSASTTLLPNIEYTPERESDGSATTSVFKFRLKSMLSNAAIGQVCYAHGGTQETWTPVFHTGVTTAVVQAGGDLIISPLQPTEFTVVTESPEIGQALQVTFTGSGLGEEDSSYLVKCTTAPKDNGTHQTESHQVIVIIHQVQQNTSVA